MAEGRQQVSQQHADLLFLHGKGLDAAVAGRARGGVSFALARSVLQMRVASAKQDTYVYIAE
jgi:hypothetical protein